MEIHPKEVLLCRNSGGEVANIVIYGNQKNYIC